MRTRPREAEVGQSTQAAVLNACDFELARALRVRFVARGAHLGVVGEGGVEGVAEGELCAFEGLRGWWSGWG